ncbi:hypothetical protein T4E_5865 [Trichinella pseudospiralis]|uniref:ZP domain-containing protein n=1 Tax=Trichinella pseudospiralis TaxID=6337 RepID=A0A0V0WK67_TRIPS|nr:hypothetical protein T4E_5865 [Trichinella pseudospiralis]
MKAWAFPTSNQISIYCNLQFCGTNCTYSCQDGEAEKTTVCCLHLFSTLISDFQLQTCN